MVARVGAQSIIQNAASNTVAVTVPATATGVIAFWHGYEISGALNALTLNGVAFDFTAPFTQQSSDTSGFIGTAGLRNPATGSQTLAWTWSATLDFGGQIALVYVLDHPDDATWVRNSTTVIEETASGDPGAITVNSGTSDLVMGMACGWPAPDPDAAITGQTVFQEASTFNSMSFELAEVDSPGASTTDFDMATFSFAHMAAISLRDSGGASGTSGGLVGRKSLLRGLV